MGGRFHTSRFAPREFGLLMGATGASPSTGRPALHVLTLTPFFPSEGDDAAGCFVAEPLDALARAGVRNTVLALQPLYRKRIRASASSVRAEWLRYFSLPGGFGLPSAGAFAFARIVGCVRELHRTQRVDLIHAHAPLPCGHTAMLLSGELGIPYVVSVHGLDAFSTRQVTGRAGEWCRRISQRVYRGSRRVICISEHVREEVLRGVGPGCRTSVVYNGVDPELFSLASESKPEEPIVLSVGNLIPIKGHAVLIRAVAEVASEFPTLTLEIVGDGPEFSRLEQLAQQLGIRERTRFLGRQSRRQVADAMRRCTAFALPSAYEGLGCVYLEAMSSGKPVIGCRGQGIAEVIRQASNGFLVGPDNEKELALVLGMLLRDETKRRVLGTAARDTILESLTLERQAENLMRIYRECAA
jgi:teichuronic acid biosynthesis glycosyltransferase TuaC